MKIIDALELKGKPIEIPGTTRKDLPKFFTDMGFKTGAEVGVYMGDFTKLLCQAGLKVYGIDPWMVYKGFDRIVDSRKKRQEEIYERTKRRLGRYKNAVLIRKTSMDALEDFEDESLDFVYIDGNHSFRYVAEDIAEWTKKVRPGGIVSGHDYKANTGGVEANIFQVRPVIDAYVKTFNIESLYVFGDRDNASSWFWIKK